MRNLSLATIFAAASGFVVMWIASWALDAEHGYNSFLAYWGLFFACTGLIDGITQETTRAVAASRETDVRGTANPWKLCLLYTSPSPRDLSTSRMPSSA